MKKRGIISTLMLVLLIAFPEITFATDYSVIGEQLPIWSCLPFIGMLLSIAIFPLVAPKFWEKDMLGIAILWSLAFLIPFGLVYGARILAYFTAESIILDYLPFIVLLFGLFVVAGGIHLSGTLLGTTKLNVILLLIGTVLSSWIGTTGAAMLLIRTVIKANSWRKYKSHIIIFFIFMVANMGGCLTPVGDPPLFLGFLRGVPFFWTMKLLPILLFNTLLLITIFIIMDRKFYKKEIAEGRKPQDTIPKSGRVPLKLEGCQNFIYILMVVGAVVLSGILGNYNAFTAGISITDGVILQWNSIIQMGIILLAAFLSMKTTSKKIRHENNFNFEAIAEVAKLFIGIFLTMIPALAILKAKGSMLGLSEPWQFFWITGALSSFLDNAPTYLVFLTTAGSLGVSQGVITTVGTVSANILLAISAGAVFMGANTYIGNAPNFMIKSIAEKHKIKMPSFFGYMGWSFSILIPIFLIDTFIFFLK